MEWRVSTDPVPYEQALAAMEERARAIRENGAEELVWLLEHPPLYTSGSSAKASDLLNPQFPVHETGRGGQYTYHGPGQRVAYLMLDLTKRGKDVRLFVQQLEGWMIRTLNDFGVESAIRQGRVGVWVMGPDGREAKIAAIGIRLKSWVSLHGISLNVSPDLSHYAGIVPCGIAEYGVTSLAALGIPATMSEVDARLKAHFEECLPRDPAHS
ncbi:MAG: lipoyl(octanoyl) transferase LipB [Alphaproteobacteria bacterium]|nr:lipoyl(octanoyl) transferase LipB [Alphaproteobacteria bacterium]